MQYGLAAWGLREEPSESQLVIAQRLGVDLLEFSIANYDKDVLQLGATDQEIANVKKLYQNYGIRLECGCTGNDFTLDEVNSQVEKVREVIDIATKLGIRYLRIFAGFSSDSVVYGERMTQLLEALQEVNRYALTRSLTLCVETHGGVTEVGNGALLHFNSVSTRVDHWVELLKTGVSIAFDPANLVAAGQGDPTGFYTRFQQHIPYIHLKDFKDVPGGVQPTACGEGRLDWTKLMSTLVTFSGPAMIEYELTSDVEDGMRRSLDFLKRF